MNTMLRRTEATCSTEVSRDLVFAVLADHELYHEWLPGVDAVRILDREGDVVVVEVRAPRLYEGNVVLELIHSPPEELLFRRIGHDKSEIAGRCELSEAAGGSRMRLELRAETPFLRFDSRRRLRDAAGKVLVALTRRLRELDSREAAPAEGKRKILEILERDDRLEIRLRGQHYHLVRVDDEGEAR